MPNPWDPQVIWGILKNHKILLVVVVYASKKLLKTRKSGVQGQLASGQ